jgi:fatty acid synthase, bacteria type
MTYLQWFQRYVELTIGEGNSTADTASPGSPWLAHMWRDRFEAMLKRAEARLHRKDFGPIETLFTDCQEDAALLERPADAIAALLARYPDAATVALHPADVPFFVQLCKTLGKPVNFVPVIDKDVRRWWRSDSLWQAHDARYDAEGVCIIPGTAAVAGITRIDEPVGELLDRFERASVAQVLASGAQAQSVACRRRAAPTSPDRWPSCWTPPTCCGPDAPRPTRCTASPIQRSGRCTGTAAPQVRPPVRGSRSWGIRPSR